MIIDTISQKNQGVLMYRGRGEKSMNALIAAPNSVIDPLLMLTN